jgi:tripartite-type tricarboxylate transporter receptor subunit TctC
MTILMIDRRKLLAGAGIAGAAVMAPAVLRAQSYAKKPVRIVVGNSAGGSNDILARMVAPVMAEELGQPVTVENRPGAAGGLGLSAVVNSAPDGHTLFCSSMAIVATRHTYANPVADPVTDLEHITTLGTADFVFNINADVPAKDLQEFIAYSKANPGKLKVGSPGQGGDIHLQGELFKLRTGIEMNTVHYSQVGALLNDVLTNQIQLALNAVRLVAPHIKAGKLRPLFVASKEREPQIPDVPTSAELGLKDLDVITTCFGMHAPQKTPQPILDQIYKATVKGIEVNREKLVGSGYKPLGDSPESFRARIDAFDRVFAEVAKAAHIKVG